MTKADFEIKENGVLVIGKESLHTLQVDPSAWRKVGEDGIVLGAVATVMTETGESGVSTVCILKDGVLKCYGGDVIAKLIDESEVNDAGSDCQD